MATLREAQKEMTRKLLLDAGLELFVSKGYATTKVDDIASAAGTTRVTFYAYFPSKVDLMKALIAERLNRELDRVRALLDEWLNEAIGDIEDGLDRADRFPAGTRHFRSVIAITELDHVARHWTPGHWGVEREQMLDVLTESWIGSIGRR
jgi:AcrR family transcriptional regulator